MKGRIPAPAKALTLLDVYPVGSIYISTSAADPGTLFGGTWEQLKDRFLLGTGDMYSNGATGGSATHTLTANQLPKISGSVGATFSGGVVGLFGNASGAFSLRTNTEKEQTPTAYNIVTSSTRCNTVDLSFGNNEAHNNMPPYLAVYMWKRTA